MLDSIRSTPEVGSAQHAGSSIDSRNNTVGSRESVGLPSWKQKNPQDAVVLSCENPVINDQQSLRSAQPHQFTIPYQPSYTSRNRFSTLAMSPQCTGDMECSPRPFQSQTWPVNDHVRCRLLSLYFKETSKWCEGIDSSRTFSEGFGHLARESFSFAAAAISLASTQDLQFRNRDHSDWLFDHLYHFALSMTNIHTTESKEKLLAEVLLCYFCAYFSELDGLVMHLQNLRDAIKRYPDTSTGNSTYVCFWAVARLGIRAKTVDLALY